jgi:acetyltransferase-like isoleucine patch superfamily enzyme
MAPDAFRKALSSRSEIVHNCLTTSIPSRRMRRPVLSGAIGVLPGSVVVCRGVRLLGSSSIIIGERSIIGSYVLLDGRGGLEIHHDVDIAPRCSILSLEHDPDSPTHDVRAKPVVIEDHVWIATGAIVLPGAHIRRGAVVAAGAVVRGEVAERAIVAGNPARLIGERQEIPSYRLTWDGRFR